MEKIKAHVKFYVREAIATVTIDQNGDVVEIDDIQDIGDLDDIEVKERIY